MRTIVIRHSEQIVEMVVTEIPARVVLHERPSDIPTCYRQTPTNIILLQTPLRVVT